MSEPPAISGHRLVRLLGEGGMGRVYLAEDVVLRRQVAVKVLSDRVSRDPDAYSRFLREARAMATLERPHVVRVYSFGESEGAPYLVMEYIQGEALAERITREGALEIEESLRVALQIVDGLEAAWQAGLVHRDIKPSNLLLDHRSDVHVADFGLAKPLERQADVSLTTTGVIVGSPHYLSPEQALGRVVDFRTDVYSLGIVLYEMLTGTRPFQGATPVEIVAQHLHTPLPSPRTVRPEVPADLVELLETMTAKDPAARPSSYAELRARIRAILTGTRFATDSRRRPSYRSTGRSYRRLAAGLLLVLAIALLWWRWPGLVRPIAPRLDDRFRLVIAVAPFRGPDEDSAKEGRLMAALVEKAIAQRLPGQEIEVLAAEQIQSPVHDHAEARALAERLGANIVVWGDILALRGESEIQPYFTLVPRRRETPGLERRRHDDRLDRLGESAAETVRLGAATTRQIELRRISAAGIGDLVLVLAGAHALYAEDRPAKALGLFDQAPTTSETLRYRFECLVRLGRREVARQALEKAVALDPRDAQAWAALGDLHVEEQRMADAFFSYSRLATLGGVWSARHGMVFEGKLYARELVRSDNWPFGSPGWESQWETGYLLAIDPAAGKVVERYRLPLPLASLSLSTRGLTVSCAAEDSAGRATETLTLVGGRFLQPVFLGGSLGFRMRGMSGARTLAAGFEAPRPDGTWEFRPHFSRPGLAGSFQELEASLRAARARDPTQPWILYYLGQAAWWQGRKDEAAESWRALLAPGSFPAIPYYEYAHMASGFDRLGQEEWAARAHAEALARRARLAVLSGPIWLIERHFNTPYINWWASARRDLEQHHAWLARAREFGLTSEGEDVVAALWARRFRALGQRAAAEAEAAVMRKVRDDPINPVQWTARFDYVLELGLALGISLVATVFVLGAFARRRRREDPFVPRQGPRPALVRYLQPGERRVLLTGSALTSLAFLVLLPLAHRVDAIGALPLGLGDSFGNPSMRADLERMLTQADSADGRFVLAVAYHVAGNAERARALYEGLAQDARARRNLDALRAGNLRPPENVTHDDLLRAYSGFRWSALPARIEEAAHRSAIAIREGELPRAANLGFLTLFAAVPPLVLGLLLLFTPPGAVPVAARSAFAGLGLSSRFVPGLADLRAGRPGRGYAALLGATVAVVAVGCHAQAARHSGVGPTSAGLLRSLTAGMSLPDGSYEAVFSAYRDSAWFWALVGALACASIVLHLLRAKPHHPIRDGFTSDALETQTHPSGR